MADRVVSMEVRLAVAFSAQPGDAPVNVTAFCAEIGVSRAQYYRLRERFDRTGLEGLLPRSRRPQTSPTAIGEPMVGLVVAKRAELVGAGLDHGAVSIGNWLTREGHQPPSARTIHRILVAAGVVEPQPRKRPRGSYRRFEHARANECWQMDGHDRPLAGGEMVKVLRIQDDCSRLIACSLAAASENLTDAWTCVETGGDKYGLPAMFLTDNATAYSHRRRLGVMNEFEARLRLRGILPITSSVGHPQTCGKKEREWQTLDRWLDARPLAASLDQLQAQLDAYDLMFNNDRVHQALGGLTPAERFQQAEKATAADHPLHGPAELHQVRVRRNGVIDLGGRYRMSLGTQWAHATVTVLRQDPACAIFHDQNLVEFLHLDPDHDYQPRSRR